MRQWSLDQLSIVGVRPVEYVEIAARAGYDAISPMFSIGDSMGLPVVPLRAGDPETVAMARALKDTGLRVNQADGFAITESFNKDAAKATLDLIAEFGARNFVALNFDPDEKRSFDRLCWLAEQSKETDVGMVVEFTAISYLPSLSATLKLVERIGQSHVGILVDILHLAQAKETIADLKAAPRSLIRGAQLNDARANLSPEEYHRVAMGARMIPGTGDLPVREFVAAIPDSVIIGIEAPVAEPKDWNERAAVLLKSAKALV